MAQISRHAEAPSFLRWFDKEVLATLENTRKRMRRTENEALDIDITESTPPDKF